MTKKNMKPFPPIVACLTLIVVGVSTKAVGQTEQSSPTTAAAFAPAVAPQTPAQLGARVAPIALYPDALVAQVLAASTFPDQVAFADDWLAQNGSLQGKNLDDFAKDVVISTQPGAPPIFDGYSFRVLAGHGKHAKDKARSYVASGRECLSSSDPGQRQ